VTTTSGPAAILSNLRVALDSLGDALALPALDRIVDAEPRLALAVEHSRRLAGTGVSTEDRRALREEILRVRAALDRCRTLGASLGFVTRTSLTAQGRGTSYDRQGGETVTTPAGAFEARG
jgi:hypothetical protein